MMGQGGREDGPENKGELLLRRKSKRFSVIERRQGSK
jgi:hypothetical protein